MDELDIHQRTKDGLFEANELLRQWNKRGGPRRKMSEFMESPKTKEFIEEIEDNESHSREDDYANNQAIAMIKGKATKRGKLPDKIWMHPYLFIDFAMWINPRFKYQVIKFVYDQLIEFRHDAGNMYVGLSRAIGKFDHVDYGQVGRGLNWIIFGKHEKNMRQVANQKKLKEMADLEKQLAFACDMGYIRNYSQLINEMRRIYHSKNAEFQAC